MEFEVFELFNGLLHQRSQYRVVLVVVGTAANIVVVNTGSRRHVN